MRTRALTGVMLATAAILAAVFVAPRPVYSHKPITTNILFKNEIAQIFQRKCFQCHSDNNVAMSLTSYTVARPWARAIREEVLDREMPPWSAVRGYGHFSNDLSLNQREMEIILSWTDGGAPSGVLKAEEDIVPVYVPAVPVWDHGEPDAVFKIGDGHAVEAYAPFSVARFVVATNLPAPQRLHAIALKQGDRRVVRHASFYDEATGRWLGAWTPWQTSFELPAGAAHRLPARARLVVEIGYAGGEEPVTDQSELGLYFEDGDTADVKTHVMAAAEATLAPGASGHKSRAEWKVADTTAVAALWLDPGAGARSVEFNAISPDGVVTPLLWVKDYVDDWRTPYVLTTPVTLARGSRVLMTTYSDHAGDQPQKIKPSASLLLIDGGATSR